MGFKKWVVKSDNIEINEIKLKAQVFSKKFKISLIVAEILIIRGMDTEEKIQNHLLNNNFSNPFLLKDMEKAVERIKIAYENQEKILICGDYDADGITATYILYHYLENYGCDVKFYIPERSDGYGLSKKLIASAKNNSITLIITVDNGISCFEEIEFSKAMGMDVIVTDHHKPPEKIPVCCAVIDPHQEDCQSPIGAKNLCGAGVALKLILAIEGEEDYLESFCFEYYCQIAAIGTIADIVSLKDENRFIVQKGIEFIKNSDVSGLIALFNNAGVDIKKVNSSNIAFGIVPRINATGRMNSAKMALNLLLCENEEEVLFYVNEISSQNNKRKETEQFIIEEIEKDIKENPEKLNGRIGIFYNQGWNHGVIGIVCARLMEKLQKPIILISIENGEARGSARSFEGFNIYDALNSCADIFTKFGGHDMAAGFSLPLEKIDEFIYAIEQYSKNNYKNMPFLTLNVDMQISPEFLTIDNIESLNILEPFGKDNTLPIFLMKDVIIVDIVSLTNGKYVKLKILKDNKALEFMVFNKTFLSFEYIKGDIIDIAFDVSINIYNDKKSITLKVVDIIPSKFNFTLFEVGKNIYDSFKRNEEISSSNAEKILPTQEDMLNVYKYIKQNPNLCKTEEILYSRMLPYKINYCKMLIIIDVLYQLNLIGKNETGIYSLPYKEKVDFKTTEIYKKIEKYIKK